MSFMALVLIQLKLCCFDSKSMSYLFMNNTNYIRKCSYIDTASYNYCEKNEKTDNIYYASS